MIGNLSQCRKMPLKQHKKCHNPTLHGGGVVTHTPAKMLCLPTIWQMLSNYGKNTEKIFSRIFGVSRGVILGWKCIFLDLSENCFVYKSSYNHPT